MFWFGWFSLVIKIFLHCEKCYAIPSLFTFLCIWFFVCLFVSGISEKTMCKEKTSLLSHHGFQNLRDSVDQRF